MNTAILSLGTATPPRSITQARAAELAGTYCLLTRQQARLLPTLYRRACVDQRGSVLLEENPDIEHEQSFFMPARDDQDHGPTTQERMERYAREAPLLALSAARRAVAGAGVDPAQLTQVVTVTCTGFQSPGVDVSLIQELGIPSTVGRTQIGFMGCHGAMNGLRVAAALASCGPPGPSGVLPQSTIDNQPSTIAFPISRQTAPQLVLLCAVELCTLHFYYGWDPEKIVANAIFADGAAAMVIGPAESAPASASAPGDAWRIAGSGSCIFPDSQDAMSWHIGNHGFVMTLSPRVPDLISRCLPQWMKSWLAGYGLTIADIRSWAIHPGGPRITKAVAGCLGLPDGAVAMSDQVLAQCGNMSSPTLLFILDRLRRAKAPRPCVALGFGPGLAAEAALFL